MSDEMDDLGRAVVNDWLTKDDLLEMLTLDEKRQRYLERYYGTFPRATDGELLFRRWCGSRDSDRARYYKSMNPAEKKAWEHLAEDIKEYDPEVFARLVREY